MSKAQKVEKKKGEKEKANVKIEQFRQHTNIQQQRKPTQDEFKSEKHFSEIYCPIAPFKISKDKLGTLLLVILL